MRAWQEAHSAAFRCWSSCSRIVTAPRRSGSTAGTSDGGGGAGLPRRRSSTHAPRVTGDVVVPFAVTFRTAAWVRNPPRGLPGGSCTRRIFGPLTPAMP